MGRKQGVLWLIALLLLAAAGCGSPPHDARAPEDGADPGGTAELTVSAAASLTDSMQELAAQYQSKHPKITVTLNFGSSGTLQQQIEQGAPVDVFLSAGRKQMEALEQKHLIESEESGPLLANQLVVIVPASSDTKVTSLADLAQPAFRQIAIGEPDTVPAGTYAREALMNGGLWEGLKSRLVFAKDVRQVLSYVETRNADAGLVYRTDALSSGKVKAALVVDPAGYSRIEYPVGVIKTSRHVREAADFVRFLRSPEAMKVFASYGFTEAGAQ